MDETESDFVAVLLRYCKGIRTATTKPRVAEQAAVYEQWLAECLERKESPRVMEVANAK